MPDFNRYMSAYSDYTTEELYLLIARGDEQAFDLFYQQNSLQIYRKILRMVKIEAIAEELTQEVFVKLWEKRGLIDAGQSLRSYLYRIARNLIMDFYRKAARDEKLKATLINTVTAAYNPTEEKLYRKEARSVLQEAIRQLPPRQKLIFNLCKIEGKTYKDVSIALGISTATVNNHIVKATKFVKNYLIQHHYVILLAAFSLMLMAS